MDYTIDNGHGKATTTNPTRRAHDVLGRIWSLPVLRRENSTVPVPTQQEDFCLRRTRIHPLYSKFTNWPTLPHSSTPYTSDEQVTTNLFTQTRCSVSFYWCMQLIESTKYNPLCYAMTLKWLERQLSPALKISHEWWVCTHGIGMVEVVWNLLRCMTRNFHKLFKPGLIIINAGATTLRSERFLGCCSGMVTTTQDLPLPGTL